MDISLDFFIQQCVNALQWGSFYALIALGYTLVYGVLRLINFAHGDVFMVGAYVAFFVATWFLAADDLLGISTSLALFFSGSTVAEPEFVGSVLKTLTLILTIPITVILTSFVGVTLERVAYRPLRRKGAHRLYVVITALMCGLILENGNLALLGASRKSMPELLDKFVFNFGGIAVTNLKLLVIFTAMLVFFLLHFVVTRTRIGMAMRAVSWDEFALPLMGIPLDRVIVFTFMMGSGIAGLGGMLFGMSYPVLDPYMGAMTGWKAFIAAVVGGIGDIRGAFVGGFLLAFVEVMVTAFLPSTFRDLFSFTILLLILWKKPTGIFGMPQTTKI
jgi:branched-chain amino acid transport system permease protein